MEQILIDEWNITSTIKKLNKIYPNARYTITDFAEAVFEHNRRFKSRPLYIEILEDMENHIHIDLYTKFKTLEIPVMTCIEIALEADNRFAIIKSIEAFEAGLRIMGRHLRAVKTL